MMVLEITCFLMFVHVFVLIIKLWRFRKVGNLKIFQDYDCYLR